MEKPVIKEIIVVEGRDDTRRLKEAVVCETIETNGSAINERTLEEIENWSAFTEEQRQKIMDEVLPEREKNHTLS